MTPLARHPAIDRLLANAKTVVAVSVSGGKDSQAMLQAIVRDRAERGWVATVVAVHADLGRVEWPQTPGHVAFTADQAGVPLKVVRRKNGVGRWDMLDHWIERGEKTSANGQQGRPWSDAKNRFCTSDLKRDPINSYLRTFDVVISAEGIRAQESSGRARKPVAEGRTRIATQKRVAWTWNPLLHWSAADVWAELGSSLGDLRLRQMWYRDGDTDRALRGWGAHPAYVMGNERLSCMFCILGCENDLRNAARENPALLADMVAVETRFGFAFQQGKPLSRFQ